MTETEEYSMDIKEIGGDFYVSKEELKYLSSQNNSISSAGRQYVSTCRSAIREFLKDVNAEWKVAFVPSFTCHIVVEPFTEEGYNVHPYSLNKDLTVNWLKMMNDIETLNPSVILLHSYFGIDTLSDASEYINAIKENGVYVIEDETHSMFSNFNHIDTRYHIGSIRKWFSIPDGAFVEGLDHISLNKENDNELIDAKLKAMNEKSNYLSNPEKELSSYRESFVIAEELLDTRRKTYGMSEISFRTYNSVDWNEYYQKRRSNYNYLAENINNSFVIPILPKCKQNEVPFMFPVYVKDCETRKALQRYMVENKVFPTIIWGIPDDLKGLIDDNAKYIYEHILCFHCDQRYNIDDMNRLIILLNNFK